VIDLHSHVLPGLDDGARSIDESLQILADAAREGITAIAATPHVRVDYPTTAAQMLAGVEELRERIATEGIPVTLLPGGELDLEELDGRDDHELTQFGLGGNPRYLLLEFPYLGWPLRLPSDVSRLVLEDVTPVLAHPERNADVQRTPSALEPLVRHGALVQLTASSLTGALGPPASKAAFEILRLGLAHLVSSDVHSPAIPRAGLQAATAALRDERLASWLMCEVPAAILDDASLPERPPSRDRHSFFRRRRRR
jgi:protein-tyrosine phosphatase